MSALLETLRKLEVETHQPHRGYSFEAAAAALGIAFDTLGWARAISLIAPLNLRSIRLAERLGERFERNLVVRGGEMSLYAIARKH